MAETTRQPWLDQLVTILAAPVAALSAQDGQIEDSGAQGVFAADTRVLSRAVVEIADERPVGIGHSLVGADSMHAVSVARALAGHTPDPAVRLDRHRAVSHDGMTESLVVSTHDRAVRSTLRLVLASDFATIEAVKSGTPTAIVPYESDDSGLLADDGTTKVRITAPDARVSRTADGGAVVEWPLQLEPGEHRRFHWALTTRSTQTVVAGYAGDPWPNVSVTASDSRWGPWVEQSVRDLRALLLTRTETPSEPFLAAGSPWFFTLFGRDSILAARLLLPFGTGVAAGTLRTLADLQGSRVDVGTAEQPGKIPHELRGSASAHHGVSGAGSTMVLPPLYYGTIDATPLWICLLHDAWRWGLADDEVRALLPQLEAALAWMRDYGDPDGDGFLEYLDESGRGLSNQGWKDSGDSVRFADGRIATGPVALCEVQAYAYEAARHGADLLDAFGRPGSDEWRGWAEKLKARFRERFWVFDGRRRYPALALDGEKKPVDAVTSNIAHLLGTGLLDEDEARLVADLIVSPELNSGFGLRTMSTDAGGYFPLSYHCGSVWAHDTALAVRGLATDGFGAEALALTEGLLAAAEGFSFRLPELYSGDDRRTLSRPAAYPAACRPQAWAAAAIGAALSARLGLSIGPDGLVATPPPEATGTLTVSGLRYGGEELTLSA